MRKEPSQNEIGTPAAESHEDRLRRQFGLRAGSFNRSAHWITDAKLTAALLRLSGPPGQGLALCCGTGIVGSVLTRAGWRMTGIDLTPEMVAEAARSFTAVVGNVERLPFADSTFDLAIMRQAYFLLGNGPRALAEARRVLKPQGRLVIAQTVPFSEVDTPWLRRVHETKQKQMTRFFTADDLRQELTTHGFAVEAEENVTVRESVSLWMEQAPEMESERRAEVLRLVREAPEAYRILRQVEVRDGEILENWNWVVYAAKPAPVPA